MNNELYRILDTDFTRECMTGFQGYVFEKVGNDGKYIVLNTFDGELLFNAEDIEKIDLKKVTDNFMYTAGEDYYFEIDNKGYILYSNNDNKVYSCRYECKVFTISDSDKTFIINNCLEDMPF